MQTPGRGIARLALLNAHDDVAVPRPRVFAVEFAWARRSIRVGAMPPSQLNCCSRAVFSARRTSSVVTSKRLRGESSRRFASGTKPSTSRDASQS